MEKHRLIDHLVKNIIECTFAHPSTNCTFKLTKEGGSDNIHNYIAYKIEIGTMQKPHICPICS